MFERFKERAPPDRRARAAFCAFIWDNYIGTEHELLGLVLRLQRHVETRACPSSHAANRGAPNRPSRH
jgi:hypothetical protein